MKRPKGRGIGWIRLAAISLGILVLDRLTKSAAIAYLEPVGMTPVLGDWFRLVYVENRGAAFGILSWLPDPYRLWFFSSMTAAAVVVIVMIYPGLKPAQSLERIALAFVLGGALGNLWDRVVFGSVIDFLDFGLGSWRWPAFNVADSAIVVGLFSWLLVSKNIRDEGPTHVS